MTSQRRCGALAAASLTSVIILAGCSSSGSDSGSGPSAAAVSQAKKYVAKVSAAPTGVGIDAPIKQPPVPGKLVVFLLSPSGTAKPAEVAVSEATKAINWRFEVVNYGTTPEQENAAFDQALQLKPDAIIEQGAPVSVIQTSLAKTKAAHIPVFSSSAADAGTGLNGNGIVSLLNGPTQLTDNGIAIANWMVADHEGGAFDVAIFNLPQYPVLSNKYFSAGVAKTLHTLCPACHVTNVDANVADIGKALPQTVVSTLQQNRNIKYVLAPSGFMTSGWRAALREASMDDVKIAGSSPSVPNLNALGSGDENAWMGQDSTLLGWRFVDAIIRYFDGQNSSVAENALLPNQLLVAGKYKPTGKEYSGFAAIRPAFLKLWGVSS